MSPRSKNVDISSPDTSHQPDLPDKEPHLQGPTRIIHLAVWALALMMVLVIVLGVIDVGWMLFDRLRTPPVMFLGMEEMLEIFGAFLAVLIAIEIFINITLYLRDDVVHVKIVLATAFIAVARKVITLDAKETPPEVMYGVAALILAMSVGYFLVVVYDKRPGQHGE